MNLLLLDADQMRGTRAVLSASQAQHARDVLRVVPGQELRVGMLDGPRGVGRVVPAEDSVELECTFDPEPPPVPDVDLLLALPRPKVMRRLWAQLAALGVGRIILTNAARVERNYFDTHVLDPAVYRPLLAEGLQQAQDTRLPRVSIHRRFRPLIEDELDTLSSDGRRLVAHPSTGAAPLAWPTGAARVLMAIGPEGGWDDYEVRLLETHGFTPAHLGSRTLRTDTACIALLAALRASRPGQDIRRR